MYYTVQRKIVVGENFDKFGKMNVICQYFSPKMSILKYLHPLAEAEAKFDPSGQVSLYS